MTLDLSIRHPLGAFDLDLDFSVSAKGIIALFGPSGAGKSSVLAVMAGLMRPQSGYMRLNGSVLLDRARGIHVPPHRRHIGMVFQDGRLFMHMSVKNNLLYGWKRTGRRADSDRLSHVISLLGLDDLLARRPQDLSGGEKQRVALGRALLADVRLLLLDEPMTGLDDARRLEILPWLERLRDEDGPPILYVSHRIEDVMRLADHVIVMDRGRVKARGRADDVLPALDLLPVTGTAGAVLEARVASYDPDDGLLELVMGHERLLVNAEKRAEGDVVRLHIAADDVTLALTKPDDISANVVLATRIGAIRHDGQTVLVSLCCEGQSFMARITKRSLSRLSLSVGQDIYAIVKTVRLVL